MFTSLLKQIFTWFWGEWDSLIVALTAFIVVEALSSILLTIFKKIAKPNYKLWIARHITLFLIIGIGNITDCYLINGSNAFRSIIILFYIKCEGTAILKNAGALGLPIPQRLSKFLVKLYDDEDDDF